MNSSPANRELHSLFRSQPLKLYDGWNCCLERKQRKHKLWLFILTAKWPKWLNLYPAQKQRGRRGDLEVNTLASGSSGPNMDPKRGHCVLKYLGKGLHSHASLPTQVYKWVPENLILGVTLCWNSIPSRGEKDYSYSRFMQMKPEISGGLWR